ncbi:MAG: response regulator, partial [Gammaproteobacteria bacterium]|nr:response regulator [Gammaproteobacteria bacterium]
MGPTFQNPFDQSFVTEHNSSIFRLGIYSIILVYSIGAYLHGLLDKTVVLMYIAAIPFSLLLLLWLKSQPKLVPARRLLGMFADIGTATYAMSVSGEAASPLFAMYLWTTFGNVFRFGKDYLHLSLALSAVGFVLVLNLSPFWSNHLILGCGLLLTLIILVPYISNFLQGMRGAVEKADNANHEKSRFLANMSHEIRTPLNGVIGMSDMLGATHMTKEQSGFVSTIQASAHTLLALIEDILDLSKIEAGKATSENIDFDLHELIHTSVRILFQQAESKGLDLKLHISPDVPYKLNGDAMHLRQVLINLLGNAIKFTDRGKVEVNTFSIKTNAHYSWLRFEIKDTGIGIPKEEQGKIFDPFSQANHVTTGKHGGTGLGTAISRRLVELMGGKIGVTSEVGRGATFWFELTFNRQSASYDTVLQKTAISDLKILLVATTESRHTTLVNLLSGWKIDFDHAVSANDAYTKLRNAAAKYKPYHVAFIDEQGSEIRAGLYTRQYCSDPLLRNTYLVLISNNRNQIINSQHLSSGYFCVLNIPIRKKMLFNILHAASQELTDSIRATRFVNLQHGNLKVTALNILVAEDNQTNQKVIRTILEYAGYHVHIVENGREALNATEQYSFDLIILDMHMPEMDGIETANMYRFTHSDSKHIPIIILTADATLDALNACLNAGIDAFLTKPVQLEKLLQTISSLTGKKPTID